MNFYKHQGFPNFSGHQNRLEALFKHRLVDPTPRDYDSGGLGRGWVICISTIPGHADAAGLATTLRTTSYVNGMAHGVSLGSC